MRLKYRYNVNQKFGLFGFEKNQLLWLKENFCLIPNNLQTKKPKDDQQVRIFN